MINQLNERGLTRDKGNNHFIKVGTPVSPREYASLVNEDNSDLLGTINTGLAKIKEEKVFSKIENKRLAKK